MSQKATKIGATAVVLTVAFGMLLYTSLGESLHYYKYVDEVMVAPEQWEGKQLQVHGNVVNESISRKRDTVEYRFEVERNGKTLQAYYNAIPPDDFFKEGAEVVLTGVMTADGFQATNMTAKCPSKYEERAPSTTGL